MRKVLVFGASYGSLLAAKLALAGHDATLVCRARTADLINAQGVIVRMPVKDREALVELRSHELPGNIDAATPESVVPADYDLVALAMQEPQYGAPGVRELLEATARSRVPCMSIMNMPPMPYLARIPGVDPAACSESYIDPALWTAFDPRSMTLCSPDAQAFRPPEEAGNVLQVRLASNFKAARFESDEDTAMLRELGESIDAARLEVDGETLELPVKLKVHDSVFVPLAKWAMLLAGNYRCLMDGGIRSIKDAVHTDLEASRAVYEWVVDLCVALGAGREDMVPFDKYAAAARSLGSPSSAARALSAGVPNIERVDRLVQALGLQRGIRNASVDETVARVDDWLVRNRLKG
jgi:NAD(P)-dependent dehydrogenase (short-subunit alcohol dehydrogenase family)